MKNGYLNVFISEGATLSRTAFPSRRAYSLKPLYHCPVASFRHRKGLTYHVNRARSFHHGLRQSQLQGEDYSSVQDNPIDVLPVTCPGCGAFSQQLHPDQAGFYSPKRKVVRAYSSRTRHHRLDSESESEQEILKPLGVDALKYDASLTGDEPSAYQNLIQLSRTFTDRTQSKDAKELTADSNVPLPPICDRCHNLIYNSEGVPIVHPGINSIADTIASSPFQRNHVYHIIDAADFPLSVIPKLFSALSLVRQRSKNRRAKDPRWKSGDHDATVSFIITRSDLLAPQKSQVDRMMPWFVDLLRESLGRYGEGARMGNIHLVSAKRGWWTPLLKDELRKRGGANWMVGKVNVGKSNLLEVLLPKGMSGHSAASITDLENSLQQGGISDAFSRSLSSIPLPPPQPLSSTPILPIISALPGTTASPIRLPFMTDAPSISGRGELIDLPGLERSLLSNLVKPSFQKHLIMDTRPRPKQLVIRPRQSLLIGGGLLRITPVGFQESDQAFADAPFDTPKLAEDALSEVAIMAYPFLPFSLETHITSTKKATQCQLKEWEFPGVENVLTAEGASAVGSAGLFELNTDVTKRRAVKVLRSGVKADKLFFKTFSTEILIEGVGWVELVASVRRGHRSDNVEWPIPKVEVFSPKGKFVAQRRPLEIWSMLEADLPKTTKDRRKHAKAVQSARIRRKK